MDFSNNKLTFENLNTSLDFAHMRRSSSRQQNAPILLKQAKDDRNLLLSRNNRMDMTTQSITNLTIKTDTDRTQKTLDEHFNYP